MSWIWNDPNFMEQCCEEFFSFSSGSVIPISSLSTYGCLNTAIKFFLRILNKSLEKGGSLLTPQMYKSLLKAKEAISTTDSALWQNLQESVSLAASGNYSMLHRFILGIITRLRDLPEDGWALIPGGVLLSEETPVEWLCYAVFKCRRSPSFVFSVINTGGLGLKYHSFKVDKFTKMGILQRDATIVLGDVIPDRLLHSAFWFAVYRLMYVPSIHNYETLYSILLPFLNLKPVLLNWKIDSEPDKVISDKTPSEGTTTKKLLIETFTKLRESHESRHKAETAKSLSYELSRNIGGVWIDAPLNEYKPSSMIHSVSVFVELILRQDEHDEADIRITNIIFHLSLCLLLDQELDALPESENDSQLGGRGISLFIELACKRLCVMMAEETLYEAKKETLIDVETEDEAISLESATSVSRIVGPINSAFPTVAKVAGSLGQESNRLSYDSSAPLQTMGDLYNLVALLVGKIYNGLQERLPSHALGMGRGSCTIKKQLCSATANFKVNCEFDNFGKFRLDGPNVNELAKGSVKTQLILPVKLTSVEIQIETFSDVCKVLRNCLEACTMLSNQRDAVPYTYAWRFQLIKHVLFEILPLPLPMTPEGEGLSECFWRSGAMERETQLDLLRLLQMLSRHLAVAHCSLSRARAVEGDKGIMFAVICAIADAVVRKLTVGAPSHISLLYSGMADGPVSSFGFSLGNFISENCYYSLTNPVATIKRTQVLDYFESLKGLTDNKCLLFSWENNMEVGHGDELLIHLLALQLGFHRNAVDIRNYYIGENREFFNMFPEFGYLRDIVFISKSLGWSGPIVPCARYSLEDANLKWSFTSSEVHNATITVKAFGKQLKVAALGSVRSFDDSNVTYYKRMMRWFGGSSHHKSPSSAAAPHNLAADCEIENETDVLHLSQLPDYGGKLGRRDSELLLQYLTAPYIRIPLVTQFFADEANLHALSSPDLQKVIIASVFEPGLWQSVTGSCIRPKTAPVRSQECLSTPLGLFFNEIYHSGSCVLSSVEKMVELALERDNCTCVGDSSKVLPFSVRLATYVCHYVFQAVSHFRYFSKVEGSNTDGCKVVDIENAVPTKESVNEIENRGRNHKWKNCIRGLKLQSEAACIELESFQKRMRLLLLEAAKALKKRAIKAARANEQNSASISMAHLALIYRYILQVDAFQNKSESFVFKDNVVSSLSSALFFVFVHHKFSVECPADTSGVEFQLEDDLEDEPLCMPDIELFGLLQSIRSYLLDYLRSISKERCSAILEKVVREVSQLGMSELEIKRLQRENLGMDQVSNDIWEEIQMPSNSGRFSKASRIQQICGRQAVSGASDDGDSDWDDVFMDTFYVDDEFKQSVVEQSERTGWAFDSQVDTMVECDSPRDTDNFGKKTKHDSKGLVNQTKKTFDKSKVLGKKVYRKLRRRKKADHDVTLIEVYEDWLKLKVMQHCDIEINFQILELSLKRNRLKLLDPWVNGFPHFVELIGKVSGRSTIQSATVQLHANRHWLRLVGRDYNLIRWERDDRDYILPPVLPYKLSTCPKDLDWLPSILSPWLTRYLPNWSVYINKSDLGLDSSDPDQPYWKNPEKDYFFDDRVHNPLEETTSRNRVRLYAQYKASADNDGEVKETVDMPVNEFDKSECSFIKDYTVEYVPHEEDGLAKFAKNATETITSIHSVITDAAAATISKIGYKTKTGKSAFHRNKTCENSTDSHVSSSKNAIGKRLLTKEIVVIKSPACIHVYDIIEEGRTWYRSLCYSSDARLTFCSCLPRFIATQSLSERKPCLVVGKPSQPAPAPKPTLLIIRNVSQLDADGKSFKTIGKEQFIPPYCLYGLLPDILLDEYDFWQNIKSSDIIGYPKSTSCEKYSKTRLYVELLPQGTPDSTLFQHSESLATVRRHHFGFTACSMHDFGTDEDILVNLQNPRDGLLQAFTETLLRLDDLSHILAWTFDSKERIELVEFAKLGLTFRAVRAGNGIRYVCEEHSGLFLNYGDIWQSPLTAALIRGLENSLLLTDDDGELYILVSTVRRPLRIFPRVPDVCVTSQDIASILQGIAWPELIYDGTNPDWLAAIDTGSRHYLYKVHSSRSFLFVPTSAAGLYLLLNRFLDRQYEQVCRLSRMTLFNDDNLNGEERVFWEVLAKIDSTQDRHPDAFACRLHLLLSANKQGLHIADGIKMKHGRGIHRRIKRNLSNIKSVFTGGGAKRTIVSNKRDTNDEGSLIKWVLHEQLLGYVSSFRYVSAGCRLSLEDERELLCLCQPHFHRLPLLANRFTILNSIASVKGNATVHNSRKYCIGQKFEFSMPLKPSVYNYDGLVDKSAIEKNLLFDAANSVFTNIRFKRPENVLTGPASLQYIDKIFQRGISQTDFLVVYELLIGSFPFSTSPNESSHCWGALLTRFICHREPTTKNIMLSTLKLLSDDATLGLSMPKCPEDMTKTKQLSSLVFSRCQQPVHKFIGEIQKTLCDLNERAPLFKDDGNKPIRRSEYALRIDATVPEGKEFVPWAFAHYETKCTRSRFDLVPCKVGDACIDSHFIKSMSGLVLGGVLESDFSDIHSKPSPAETSKLEISLKDHWIMKYAAARRLLRRLEEDYAYHLREEVDKINYNKFLGFSESQIDEMYKNPEYLAENFRNLQTLREHLLELFKSDGQFVECGIRSALCQANSISTDISNFYDDPNKDAFERHRSGKFRCWGYIFGKLGGIERLIGLDQLVDCLISSDGDESMNLLNPYMRNPRDVLRLVIAVMFAVNRRTLIARCISQLMVALQSLKELSPANLGKESLNSVKADVCTKTRILSEKLNASRHYVSIQPHENGLMAVLDPRLLLFEFSSNILLHKRQVELVRSFVDSAARGKSCCHQLIMGEGKTTVVGPLLSLLLADGDHLFVQVCPQSLLEFTRTTLRETFSAVIHKSVFTLSFSRFDHATPELYLKLLQARQTRSVVVCTPTTIKSIFLKVIYCFHRLESGSLSDINASAQNINNLHKRLVRIWNMTNKSTTRLLQNVTSLPSKSGASMSSNADTDQRSIQLELDMCLRILELFSSAVVLMDEIDLLMHPLKSELHWPIGIKKPLVHLRNSDCNIRWLLPWHLLRVLVPQTKEQVKKGENRLLERIKRTLAEGTASCHVADSPHLVLLNIHWYNGELKPLLAEWLWMFLKGNNLVVESYQQCVEFLITGKHDPSIQSIEVLNFSKEWLWSTFPHIVSRVNLVNYGILSIRQVEEAIQFNPNTPQTRKMLAVPFVGKGTPSKDSEFSHPDVLIGFTILAYMYQGLRVSDFVLALRHLTQQFYEEMGRPQDRLCFKMFNRWVISAGAKLRESQSANSKQYHYLHGIVHDDVDTDIVNEAEPPDKESEIWTLDAVNVYDEEQIEVLYNLLKNNGLVIEYFLCTVLFPEAMEHTALQLTASALELGSSMLFPIRLGFSGTPSQLLPLEMGRCNYSPGTDGKILKILMDETIVKGPLILPKGWSSETVLDIVAKSDLKPLALIDTGALITNLANSQVARELLTRGLSHVDGVVYLDDQDRQMILLRNRWRSTLLTHCGIPPERRFSFYDQIHATGQDIKQAAYAMAFITVGADMTFRDYSQGAWRMRGIGRGQTLHLIIPREVEALISSDQPFESSIIKQCVQWLLVRGIQSEIKLSRLLLEQSIKNVVRKQCFQRLIENHLSISGENEKLRYCVQIFRENKDFSIQNTFMPKQTTFGRVKHFIRVNSIDDNTLREFLKISMIPLKLTDLRPPTASFSSEKSINMDMRINKTDKVGTNEDFMDIFATRDSDFEDGSEYGCVSEHSDKLPAEEELERGYLEMENDLSTESFDLEAEHEQEMEFLEHEEEEATQLRQQIREEEHATEAEFPASHRYSRSDEETLYWSLDQLAKDPSVCGFLPCKEFYLYRKDSSRQVMPFPSYMLLSPNFYKIKWSANSYRRLKNVIVILDISPDCFEAEYDSTNDAQAEHAKSSSSLPSTIVKKVKRAFDALEEKEKTVSLPVALKIVKTIDLGDSHDGKILCSCIATHLIERGLKDKITMMELLESMSQLFSINYQRKFVIVTLAEAEAVRAWLHRVNDNIGVKLGLRHLAARFQPFDFSHQFASTKDDKIATLVGLQPRIVHACMKFFNSELQYTPSQISLLQECFEQISISDRMAYFQQLREMRNVVQNIKSALSGAAQLQKLFKPTLTDEFFVRILSLKLQLLAAERGGPHGLLTALRLDKLNLRNLNELINSNVQFPVAQMNEIKAFLEFIDHDKDGLVSLEDLELSLDEVDDLTKQFSYFKGIELSLRVHKNIRRAAFCDYFEIWVPKKLGCRLESDIQYYLSHSFLISNYELNKSNKKGALGCYVLKVVSKTSTATFLDKFLVPPSSFTKIWQDTLENPRVTLWQPCAPEGHIPIGLVATRMGEEPSINSVVCPPKEWMTISDQVSGGKVICAEGFSADLEPMTIRLCLCKGFANVDKMVTFKSDKFTLEAPSVDPCAIPTLIPLK